MFSDLNRYVTMAAPKTSKVTKTPRATTATQKSLRLTSVIKARFPRHALAKATRIPQILFDQNAGKACTRNDAAKFAGLSRTNGDFDVEISSCMKFGLLEQPQKGYIQPSALAKKILRPQAVGDTLDGYRQAILKAPDISEVYQHYRGENLPDDRFLQNTVAEAYHVAPADYSEFKQVFLESLETAELIARHADKIRILDEPVGDPSNQVESSRLRSLEKSTVVGAHDSCFLMQPFGAPYGDYYEKIYRPAIEKAGLIPIRADAEIFGTGKIIDQVWAGISRARVLVAELTTRNPNVFYELGIAHALSKPVVLVSAGEEDVPFDLQHIRVIYYDVTDPFWGAKLIEKVAENILSAIQHPEEAVFKGAVIAAD